MLWAMGNHLCGCVCVCVERLLVEQSVYLDVAVVVQEAKCMQAIAGPTTEQKIQTLRSVRSPKASQSAWAHGVVFDVWRWSSCLQTLAIRNSLGMSRSRRWAGDTHLPTSTSAHMCAQAHIHTVLWLRGVWCDFRRHVEVYTVANRHPDITIIVETLRTGLSHTCRELCRVSGFVSRLVARAEWLKLNGCWDDINPPGETLRQMGRLSCASFQ